MKVISRTPLRISFAGGGSDISYFYKRYGGEVISTTIDKYITVEVSRSVDKRIHVDMGVDGITADSVDQVMHPLVRECLRWTGVTRGGRYESNPTYHRTGAA